MKLSTKIVFIGDSALDLGKESNLLIVFDETMTDETLRDIAAIHTVAELTEDVVKGDTLVIGAQEFKVTAVGDVALNTLRELGHCTLKFDGLDEVELPGEIQLKGDGYPVIEVGTEIKFL